jgi:GT2 family glycosyltransferase
MELASVIIINWNGIELTKQCILALQKNTLLPFEVIVVDNGSGKSDKAALRKMRRTGLIDKLIENCCNKGFAGANNQGMRNAKGDYLFLLNNDTIVKKNWLKELIRVAESDEKIGIVGPHLPESEKSEVVYGGGYISVSGIATHSFDPREGETEQVGGAAFLIKRSVFEKIGELDEKFYPIYFEESDYCARARKAGFKVFFAPKSTIIHFGSRVTSKQPNKWMYLALNKNRVRYMLLHFSTARLLVALFFEAARVVKSVFTLRTHWLMEAYLANLKNIGDIIQKRMRYRKGDLRVIN